MSSRVHLPGTEISNTFISSHSQEDIRKDIGSLLKTILQRIVRNPNDVMVTYLIGDRTTVYSVAVHLDDYGYLLGRKGATINSLRSIARAMLARHEIRAVVDAPHTPFNGNQDDSY
ncbi:KH domain-containing protein [Bdellovibrio sp. NC01]|uniref:KH domain-containing protein n=1 Tax=Bdellovibrio sp. NC01 TaxID=2220073 RepID=UPI001158036D|nr:KH domain-containing protein [Bdellovibrio sp. NC01]QDK38754.1 hypothetical protein DOE51_14745 [Bdellovibrio sp. NC01]